MADATLIQMGDPVSEPGLCVVDFGFMAHSQLVLNRSEVEQFIAWHENVCGGTTDVGDELRRFLDEHPEVTDEH